MEEESAEDIAGGGNEPHKVVTGVAEVSPR